MRPSWPMIVRLSSSAARGSTLTLLCSDAAGMTGLCPAMTLFLQLQRVARRSVQSSPNRIPEGEQRGAVRPAMRGNHPGFLSFLFLVPIERPQHEEADGAGLAPIRNLRAVGDEDRLTFIRLHAPAIADYLQLSRLHEQHLVVLERPVGELGVFCEFHVATTELGRARVGDRTRQLHAGHELGERKVVVGKQFYRHAVTVFKGAPEASSPSVEARWSRLCIDSSSAAWRGEILCLSARSSIALTVSCMTSCTFLNDWSASASITMRAFTLPAFAAVSTSPTAAGTRMSVSMSSQLSPEPCLSSRPNALRSTSPCALRDARSFSTSSPFGLVIAPLTSITPTTLAPWRAR